MADQSELCFASMKMMDRQSALIAGGDHFVAWIASRTVQAK